MKTGWIFLTAALGIVLAGIVWWVLRLRKTGADNPPVTECEKEKETGILTAPLSGLSIPLEQVRDDVFSAGVLGEGAAIIPDSGEVYAPVNGEIVNIPESLHAVALTGEDGTEMLIHVGIDTVNLKGEHFTLHVKEGDRVHRGQPLMTFALDKIKEAGYDPVTPMILTETGGRKYTAVKGKIRAGDVWMAPSEAENT